MGEKANILPLKAFASGEVFEHWWQYALVAILGVCVLAGVLSTLHWIFRVIRAHIKKSSVRTSLPSAVVTHLRRLAENAKYNSSRNDPTAPASPSSFGVYLGDFNVPPTASQRRILSEWDIIILDPSKAGVREAIESRDAGMVIGRLDIEPLIPKKTVEGASDMIAAVDRIVSNLRSTMDMPGKGFSGVLLAGWEGHIPLRLLNALSEVLGGAGLDVYLEITPPNFLSRQQSPSLRGFAGVVVRNGSILENGERRDFFMLEKMKTTTKAFVSQSCLRPFTVMMWETIDDDVHLPHSVLKRSYMWCGYHGAMTWVGTKSALTDSSKSIPRPEPIAAFQWLKESKVMSFHEKFRTSRIVGPTSVDNVEIYQSLAAVFPSCETLIDMLRDSITSDPEITSSNASTLTVLYQEFEDGGLELALGQQRHRAQDWSSLIDRSTANPLSNSTSGNAQDGLGCFPIGLDVTQDDFAQILKSQQRLRRLNLLDRVSSERIREIGARFGQLGGASNSLPDIPAFLRSAVRDFSQLAGRCTGSKHVDDPIQVYLGLDSGFRTPTGARFWAVYEQDAHTGSLICYISKLAVDLPRTLLHTYLSSRSFQRYHCFLAEYGIGQIETEKHVLDKLPDRLDQDLNLLSTTDILLFLQHMKFSQWHDTCPLLSSVQNSARDILLDVPTFKQIKELGNVDYIGGKISDAELVEARVNWYRQSFGVKLESYQSLQIFRDVEEQFQNILYTCDYEKLEKITSSLDALAKAPVLDAFSNFVFFSVFCAARKAAFDEVYLEVSDRNPLFNEFSDQSAAFAELFALGSRCESYFDIVPSSFGGLLSDRHREYYNQEEHQPPMWIDNAPSFASAYAAAQTDIDPDQKDAVIPAYRRLTFLSVFAIPALVDIVLLTFTGRGLYLTSFMPDDIQWATLALMVSLLLSGATGTWISIGGTYYLVSMAFSAANVFVLTRLIGGLAFTFFGGLVGFIIISALVTPTAGGVFFFYLLGLTTYLSTLAALANFQFPGTSYLNGRYVIIGAIPILFISPLITIWAPGHDPIIYLCIIFIFDLVLIVGLGWVGSRWTVWCYGIKTVDDKAVRAWYIREKANGQEDVLSGLTQPAILALCRDHLYSDVQKERNRRWWQTSEADKLVQELAACWEATIFLLDWYCRISDVKRPIPYSSTWNLETQVAKDSLVANQKGIRLHNSFLHWRNAGDDIGCGVLYFLVALLDRWVSLLYGNPLVGIGVGLTTSFRIAVGFSLAYYLVGAVLLDYKAQHLHQAAQAATPISIRSSKYIHEALLHDAKFKQKMYWKTIVRFLGVHVWALASATALLWVFDGGDAEALIMFLGYVGAYTGLLLYQYNKIFSGPHALQPLLGGFLIGFPVGLVLKGVLPNFIWGNVISLNVATWTAATISFFTAKIALPDLRRPKPPAEPSVFHSYGGVGVDHEWSQAELEAFYDGLCARPTEERFKINPNEHPGVEIKSILLSCTHQSLSSRALDAFPTAPYWAQRIVSTWEDGAISIELVSMRSVVKAEADIRAISHFSNGHMHLLISSDAAQNLHMHSISSNCTVIAETLIHACAETILGVNHDQASIAESLLVCRNDIVEGFQVSECIKRAIPFEFSESKMAAFAVSSRKALLKNLCLGLDCDPAWDTLPLEMRSALLARCMGDNVQFTADNLTWIQNNIHAEPGVGPVTRVARYDLGALLSAKKYIYFKSQGPILLSQKGYQLRTADIQFYQDKQPPRSVGTTFQKFLSIVKRPFTILSRKLGITLKFFVIALVADAEYHRELNCVIQNKPALFRVPATFVLTAFWKYSRMVIANVLPLFIFARRKELRKLFRAVQGTKISLKKDRVVLNQLEGDSTAFIHPDGNGGFKLYLYNGVQTKEPDQNTVTVISTYSKDMRLYSRAEYTKGELVNEFLYDYQSDKKSRRLSKFPGRSLARIPISRTCVRGKKQGSVLQYNYKGYIESGSYTLDGNLIRFKYHYRKNAKYDDELLRAEFVLPHLSANVSWCAPPVRHPEKMERWIPHSRVQEATFVQGADVYECSWIYDHKFHPKIITTLNGHYVETPPMIQHDWLGILKKPTGTTFLNDNPLLDFRSLKSGLVSRFFGLNTVRLPVSTSRVRSQLWKAWKSRNNIDGVVIRYLDETLLRKESLLQPYWRYRDGGRLGKAEDYLALHADAVTASTELTADISAWTPLAIRMSDLVSFGQGGDAVVYTRTKTLQPDTEDKLHVVAVDTGTWPNEGGGVSACRRDLVNNLRSIRWHMVVESANDFGLPKHQTEENVESLKIIPLWGLDFMHPCHGMFSNKLDSEVDHTVKEATIEDIKRNFLPTLTALVKGARATTMTQAEVKQSTRALVNLNTYFEDSRHWKEVWTSEIVKEAWRELWLAEDMPNTKPPSQWFHTELPTLGHLDSALDMWFRYLFIFSIPIPEQIPAVFQASHHSVSAAYGIVCKIKRHCTLQIWDHAISWRETNLYLSSALCTLPPFIRNSLLGLMKLTSALILHHADQVLPCADFFNPGWEVEIGTQRGKLTHRNEFKRKVDPIVNGIPDMQKFSPVTEIKTEKPTVTMLSHVWFAKDIKIAILAADIILNEWGFEDYHLDIYGALNKAPVYSSECQELIACKGVGTNAVLRGTADPGVVLASTWLFLNSSVSEGLPLALGEAALTGAPVVCTDVGASLRVLTDPDNGEKYSEVVAPNDAYSLARAQINILAMLGQWAKYADDPPDQPAPVLPIKPTRKDVEVITKRMYEKKEHRRKLGMMARGIVQKSFSGERYLREHEQMLWVGKANYEMLGLPERTAVSLATGQAISEKSRAVRNEPVVDQQLEKMAHPKPAWVRHASRATSFTSVYMDDGTASSMRWSAGRSGTSSVADTLSQLAPGSITPPSNDLLSPNTPKNATIINPVPESYILPGESKTVSPSTSRRVSFGGEPKNPYSRSKPPANRRQSATNSVRSATYARSALSQVYTAPNSDEEVEV